MKTYKLLQTIDALNSAERRLFGQFIAAPFFNQRADIIKLYDWLLRHPQIKAQETVFEHLYPNQPFDAQRFRLAMSYLQKLAEQFIAYQQWRTSSGAYEKDLVSGLRQHGLEAHLPEALKSAKTTLDRQPLRNSGYYLQLGQVLWEEARFESLRTPADVKYLEALSNTADLTWLTQKLRYLCLHCAHRNMYTSDQTLQLSEEVEAIVLQYNFLDIPAISTWYYCLKMLESPKQPDYFMQFKASFLEQNQLFDRDEIRDLYLFALNHCIRCVNEGETHFFYDIMGFYKDGLLKGYLIDKGVLSRSTYHNIVAAGLRTLEFEWVEDFINRYRNNLERSYRDSSYSFNLARLEFTRKRYDAALALLQHSNYYDPLLSLAAKAMLLKIYYELNEIDLLQSHLEALKNYIRRKVTLGYHRTNYLNLVAFTQKLVGLNRFDKKAVALLREKIKAVPVLTEKEWLLEQLS